MAKTLAELIGQWRTHGGRQAYGIAGPSMYEGGIEAGMGEAADELDDWCRAHGINADALGAS
jgi:hypothetical protein